MCTVTADSVTVLEPTARAPGQVRELLRDLSCATHNASVLDTAQLLASELVTNALLHGRPPIVLQVRCTEEGGLHIDVSDAGPNLPARQIQDTEADHGRGVALVDMLSDDWGVESANPGKRVWFHLMPRDPADSLP